MNDVGRRDVDWVVSVLPKTGFPRSGELRAQVAAALRRAYEADPEESIQRLAGRIDRSGSATYYLLLEAGTKFRSAPNGTRRRMTAEERVILARRAKAMYAAGADIRAISEDIGWSYGTARRLLGRAGVKLRPHGGFRQSKVGGSAGPAP